MPKFACDRSNTIVRGVVSDNVGENNDSSIPVRRLNMDDSKICHQDKGYILTVCMQLKKSKSDFYFVRCSQNNIAREVLLLKLYGICKIETRFDKANS